MKRRGFLEAMLAAAAAPAIVKASSLMPVRAPARWAISAGGFLVPNSDAMFDLGAWRDRPRVVYTLREFAVSDDRNFERVHLHWTHDKLAANNEILSELPFVRSSGAVRWVA